MNNVSPPRQRITSIDALRAFTLLGILLVHAKSGFGFCYEAVHVYFDGFLGQVSDFFLLDKCNTIFATLFGVSFYLILRNPQNSSAKFLWRCFLLALIGLLNKLIYTSDILLWYGLWGMALVPFRNLKSKYLIICSICFFLVSVFLTRFKIGDFLYGPGLGDRYGIDKSFYDVLTYPNAVNDFLHNLLNHGVLAVFAKFLFGYWIAKIGFIEHVYVRLSKRTLIISWTVFLVFFSVNYLLYKNGNKIILIERLNNYSASIAYALALLYAYYHSDICNRILKFFEPYGKLGLTNYSIGGILGVVFINEFGLGLYKCSFTVIVLFFIGFFLLQAVFSYYWLRYFTYGPMEYVWRVATERKKIPFRRKFSD